MEDKETITSLKDTLREARRLLRSDPVMRIACYQEAIKAFFNGDIDLGKLNLRNALKYGIGYEALVLETGISMQSINRMLSRRGNPTSKHLFAILRAIRKYEGFEMRMQVSINSTAKQNAGSSH